MKFIVFVLSILGILLTFTRCTSQGPQQGSSKQAQGCSLTNGSFSVQQATLYKEENRYELMLLGAPSCVEQPISFVGLALERLPDDAQAKSEPARLIFKEDGQPTLALSPDFSIKVMEQTMENGRVISQQESSSSWSPFASSMAGAVVGGVVGQMIGGAMMGGRRQAAQPMAGNQQFNNQATPPGSTPAPGSVAATKGNFSPPPSQTPAPKNRSGFFSKKPSSPRSASRPSRGFFGGGRRR